MAEEKKEKANQGRQFSQEQYDMLLRCSKKKDITDWNRYRKDNPDKKVLLEGAKIWGTNLRGAILGEANLQGACLGGANLKGANLYEANLQDADLYEANLQDADLYGANLRGAILGRANLKGAKLFGANLRGAYLYEANLQDANLTKAYLQGADFSRAIVDGGTLIWYCEIDHETKFEGVGLDAARIYPGLKQLLEYNIRRMNWEEWYSLKNESLPEICNLVIWLVKRLVRCFWAMSDYGNSTGRIIVSFFGLAVVFATIYRLWPNFVLFYGSESTFKSWWHALYFSVVTMTTLGFGDVAANPASREGLTLLMAQVIMGYVLLGALVTRFAVLFTAGGPAGKFAEEKKSQSKE